MATTNLRDAFARRMRDARGGEVLVGGGPEAERAFAEAQLLQQQLRGNPQDKLGAAWEQASKLAADRIRQNEQNALARAKQSTDTRLRQDALNLDRQTAESRARVDAGNLQLRARDTAQRNQLATEEAKQRADYQKSSIGFQERSANWRETGPMDERAGSLLKQARGMKLTDEGKKTLAYLSSAFNKIQAKRSSLRPSQYNQMMSQWMDQFERARLHLHEEAGPASFDAMLESGELRDMGGGTYWRLNDDGTIDTLQGGDGGGMAGNAPLLSKEERVAQLFGEADPVKLRKEYADLREDAEANGKPVPTFEQFLGLKKNQFTEQAEIEQAQRGLVAGVRSVGEYPPPEPPAEVEPASPSNRSASTDPTTRYQNAQAYIRRKQAAEGIEPNRGAVLPPARNPDGSAINLPPTYSAEQMAAAGADPRSTMRQDTKDYDYDPDTGRTSWYAPYLGAANLEAFENYMRGGPEPGEAQFRKLTPSTKSFRKKPAQSKMIAVRQQYMADLQSAFGGEGSPTDGGKSALALEQALSELPVESRPSMQGMIDDFALERAVQLGYENPAKHLLDAATEAAQEAKSRKGGGARKTPRNYLLMTEMEKQQYRSTPQFKLSDIGEMQTSQLPPVFFDEKFNLHVDKARFDKQPSQELLEREKKKYRESPDEGSRVSNAAAMGMGMFGGGGPARSFADRKPIAKKKLEEKEQLIEDYRQGRVEGNPFGPNGDEVIRKHIEKIRRK